VRATSRQLVQQCLGTLEVRRVEALGEPVVNRRQEINGLFAATLLAPQAGETHRGTQFPELRTLLPGDPASLVEGPLRGGFGPLLPVHFADASVQLGDTPALASVLRVFQRLQ